MVCEECYGTRSGLQTGTSFFLRLIGVCLAERSSIPYEIAPQNNSTACEPIVDSGNDNYYMNMSEMLFSG
jgi:hypothetical protein